MSDLDWLPEPHPIPAELTPTYEAMPYAPPAPRTWLSVADKLDAATHEQLLAMAKEVI